MPNLEEYTYPEGGTLRAHVVTDETAGESITVVGGNSITTVKGIVVLETERPGVYDTLPTSEWEKMDMRAAGGENAPEPAFPSLPDADDTEEDDDGR